MDRYGTVSVDNISSKIKPETLLVVVMHGNNVIGTIQPISEIGRVCVNMGAVTC